MINEKVVISENNITLERNPRSVVMSRGAKTLTELHCYAVCQNGGNILDIGFGMGFSANKIYEIADSYTCIEINPQIYETALAWARGKSNVTILKGDWIDVVPSLKQKFDGIFFDTHNDTNSHLAEEYAKLVSKEGTIFSHWNYFQIRNVEEINYLKAQVDMSSMPKLTSTYHKVCWAYYSQGKFVKGINKIRFRGSTKAI